MPEQRRAASSRSAKPKSTIKTTQTEASPEAFIASIADERRKQDADKLLAWFGEVTGMPARMWGPTMIGYGRYHYKYESGREGFALMTGFSPRRQDLTLYVIPGYQSPSTQALLARLGKHRLGKSCLYIKKLADVDMTVLAEIVREGVEQVRTRHQTWDV